MLCLKTISSTALRARLSLLLCLLPCFAQAALESTSARISGAALVTGVIGNVHDAKYFHMQANPGTWPTIYTNHVVDDFVTVGVDHASPVYVGTAYKYKFTLEVTLSTWGGSSFVIGSPQTIDLIIAYDPLVTAPYDDRATYKFSGGYKINVKVVKIRDEIAGVVITNPPDNMYLEAGIVTERYYPLNLTVQPAASGLTLLNIPASNEIEVRWNYIAGAEEYELEWTHINNYDGTIGGALSPTVLPLDFSLNSSRISTTQQFYRISNVFEKGYVLFRLRAVGRGGTNFAKRIFGRWTYEDQPSMFVSNFQSTNSGNVMQITSPHESDLKNWQYTATYVEEGKKKEVIGYFDGSLRGRQTVTKLNSQEQAVAGETIYDYNGRPAVQVMPAPVQGAAIKFYFHPSYGGLSLNTSNVPYSRDDFDPDLTSSCTPPVAGGMSTQNGASRYYSPNNFLTGGHHDYVPDAELYPFTQVEYTPDNTGRIRRQSGVGPDHQLGSNHETRYLYGKPFQPELDRLFGSEVGYALHYKKNSVIDANGQISVSYLDQQGRTIATALAGEPPVDGSSNPILDPLPTSSSALTMNIDLLNKPSPSSPDVSTDNNILQSNGTELVFQQVFTVNDAGPHTFQYNLSGTPFTMSCLGPNVCYDCVYDLTIDIEAEDPCTQALIVAAGFPVTETIGNILPPDTICDTTGFQLSPTPVTINLPVGTYTVYKTLTINQAALAFYLNHYLSDPDCVLSLDNFIDEYLSEIDTTDCHISCETCVESLGTEAEFITNGGTAAQFQELVEQCMEPCQYTTACQASYQMMLSDMSPSGQYADFMDENSNIDPSQFPLSILNENNDLPTATASWRTPVTPYEDANGNASHILLQPDVLNPGQWVPPTTAAVYDAGLNLYYSLPEDLTNVEDFINHWENSWAVSLVPYHPEYCYFEWCDDMEGRTNGTMQTGSSETIESSIEFDELLMMTNTLSAAQSAGIFLDPVDFNTPSPSAVNDPFFSSGGVGASSRASMISRMSNYQGNGFNVWQMADMAANCGTMYGATPTGLTNCISSNNGSNTGVTNPWTIISTDEEWTHFKYMYLSLKQDIQQELARDHAQSNGCYNGCIGEPAFDPFQYGYVTSSADLSSFGSTSNSDPCSGENGELYAGMIQRFPDANGILGSLEGDPATTIANLAAQNDHNYYLMTGQCPGARDLQALLNAMNEDFNLLNTTSMQDYPQFSQLLYESVEAPGTNPSYVAYDWTPSPSGQTLSATFVPDGTPACGVSLTFPSASPFTWSNTGGGSSTYRIEQFFHLQFTNQSGGDYYFTIEAVIFDNIADTLEDTVTVTGVTCLPVGNCTFPANCPASWQAEALEQLMNALKVNGDFVGTNISLTTAPYNTFFAPLQPLFGTGSWEWDALSSTAFTISDGSGLSLQITFGSSPASVITFSGLHPDDANMPDGFLVTGNTSGLPLSLSGTAEFFDGTVYTPFPLGTCSTVPLLCQTTEHYNRNDLEALLQNLAATIDQSQSLTNNAAFTPLLRGSIHPAAGASFSWVPAQPDADHLDVEITGAYMQPEPFVCELHLEFVNTSRLPQYSFANIVSFGPLQVDHLNLVNGHAYNFTIAANFSDGHSELLTGVSCWAIKGCGICGTPGPYSMTYDFESFNSSNPGFTSYFWYDPGCPTVDREYDVIDDASVLNSCSYTSNTNVGNDHTNPPNGNFMAFLVDNSVDHLVFGKTVPVNAGAIYTFSAWYMDLWSGGTPSQLDLALYVNNVQIATVNVASDPGNWHQLTGTWTGSTSGSAMIEIRTKSANGSTYYGRLGIDDISFSTPGCTPLEPLPPFPQTPYSNPCAEYLTTVATANATEAYDDYIDNLSTAFTEQYIAHCMGTVIENFTMGFEQREYHYTLYYYDQAGNLVRTVPPAGVVPVDLAADDNSNTITNGQEIINDRANKTHTYFTAHRLLTTYTFNALNQVVQQETPDAGITRFWYDALGRLRFSQNAKQHPGCTMCPPGTVWKYSYTIYDALGRIVEVGQDEDPYPDPLNPGQFISFTKGVNDYTFPQSSEQVTKTYYDETIGGTIPAQFTGGQQNNLRNRITSVSIEDSEDTDPLTYDHATHYSYDIHGNVQELIQDNPAMGAAHTGHRFKKVEYLYDLVSSKVNELLYQRGAQDQFYHKYNYDADNRITQAFTTNWQWAAEHPAMDFGWDQDAKYFYYAHGSLARTEVGDLKVQGQDFAYTIHGWIKGVNSNTLRESRDMGEDGAVGVNAWAARDEYGYSLSYFDGDYQSTGSGANSFLASIASSDLNAATPSLYNGNIRHMITAIKQFMPTSTTSPQAMAYRYDQLNRIKRAKMFNNLDVSTNVWQNTSLNNTDYLEEFAYDANGNITDLDRNGVSTTMDDFKYWYYRAGGGVYDASLPAPTDAMNQLAYVDDNPALNANYTNDIDDQNTGNYTYDRIGNLVSDTQEEIVSIDWSLYGKMKQVIRFVGSSKPHLELKYDAMGHRVSKQVTQSVTETIWYVLDAQGTPLATYLTDEDGALILEEQMLYGSARIGVYRRDCVLTATPPPALPVMHKLGKKQLEQVNHLGNALVVVSDARKPQSGPPTQVAYYTSTLMNANDYTVFGASMTGRTYTGSLGIYRYGFNGYEKDDELVGDGNSYTTEFRQYESRLGRWLSLDPELKRYPDASPYVAYLNSPIVVVDTKGDSIRITGSAEFQQQTLEALQSLTNDKLELRNGIIYITALGGQNPDKDLDYGTALIRKLNKKGAGSNTVEIVENLTCTNSCSPRSDDDYMNVAQGKSGDALVEWDPLNPDGGLNERGDKERPPSIGLGHELIHALDIFNGLLYEDNDDIIFSDEYGRDAGDAIDVEEYNTRIKENILRCEQYEPLRVLPQWINTGSVPVSTQPDGQIIVNDTTEEDEKDRN